MAGIALLRRSGCSRRGGGCAGLGQVQLFLRKGEVEVQMPEHIHANNDFGKRQIVTHSFDMAARLQVVVGILAC